MLLSAIRQIPRHISRTNKRVLIVVPFFCWLTSIQAADSNCSSSFYDSQVEVSQVHDGDTLRLTDGRKVRLIGINTPEMARKNKPADPLAHEARDTLKELLKDSRQIKLRFGKEKYDRYNRLLAHPFLGNGDNITELLLKKGLGFALVVPPNDWQTSCYKQAENYARQQKAGVWQHPDYQPVDASQISASHRGYHRVIGKVERIGDSRYSFWLNLSKGFALRIKKQDSKYFSSLPIKNLQDKTVIARGWIYKRNNEMRMRIRHPSALEVVN